MSKYFLFPKAFLKISRVADDEIDMHANICILSMNNNRAISDARPAVYFDQLRLLLGDSLQGILDSNFITTEALQASIQENYAEFTRLRSGAIIDYIKHLCTGLH